MSGCVPCRPVTHPSVGLKKTFSAKVTGICLDECTVDKPYVALTRHLWRDHSFEKSGDILGHENVGEVVEVGPEAKSREVGDRVVVPFTIVCGECFFCRNGFYFGCVKAQDIFTAPAGRRPHGCSSPASPEKPADALSTPDAGTVLSETGRHQRACGCAQDGEAHATFVHMLVSIAAPRTRARPHRRCISPARNA